MRTANIKSEAILKVIAQYMDEYKLNCDVREFEKGNYIRIIIDGYKIKKGENDGKESRC